MTGLFCWRTAYKDVVRDRSSSRKKIVRSNSTRYSRQKRRIIHGSLGRLLKWSESVSEIQKVHKGPDSHSQFQGTFQDTLQSQWFFELRHTPFLGRNRAIHLSNRDISRVGEAYLTDIAPSYSLGHIESYSYNGRPI